MKLKYIACCLCVVLCLVGFASFNVSAEPEESQAESQIEASEQQESQPEESYPQQEAETDPPVESSEPLEEEPTYLGDIPNEEQYVPEEQPDDDETQDDGIYYYEQFTQPPAEIYTERETLPRFIAIEGESGNLVVGAALWVLIIIGVIVVAVILMVTHRRKRS